MTDLRPESAISGSTDLEALSDLGGRLPHFDLIYLPSLHAKVYVADRAMAIITSGNLTDSGIDRNLEYGIVSTDQVIVNEIRRDFEGYALLGARISQQEIASLIEELHELKDSFKRAEKTIRATARRIFLKKLEGVRTQLFRHRARGKSTNQVLADTIIFLLAKSPLRTIELHPLVKSVHPDICDDTIDRVIDGVHFGKKWKHFVRTAQQQLKRQGRIRLDGETWHLVS